jgi:tetratricopeptide (TPR) repeat protein
VCSKKPLKRALPIDDLLLRAQALVDDHQWQAASRLLAATLDAVSGNGQPALQAEILIRLGLIHRSQGHLDQALAAFLLAHRLQPSDLLKKYIAEQQTGP